MLSIYSGKTVSSFNLPSLLFLQPNTKFNLFPRTLGGAHAHSGEGSLSEADSDLPGHLLTPVP